MFSQNCCFVLLAVLTALSCCHASGQETLTVWNFDDVGNRFAPAVGAGAMLQRDTFDSTLFGTTDQFGLPSIGGQTVDVMSFPAASQSGGYQIVHLAPANGKYESSGFVSSFTMIFDVLWPSDSNGHWRGLYQSDTTNNSDGEFFVRNQFNGGIGINGSYHGSLLSDRWHRVAVVNYAGRQSYYIDGEFVGQQFIDQARFSLDAEYFLLTDNNGETRRGYLASYAFVDRVMCPAEIYNLGGPGASGANVAGEAAGQTYADLRRIEVIAHRGASAGAPENTIAAIEKAWEAGADMVEVDIRLSADGQAVLMHDGSLQRTTGDLRQTSQLTVAQLKQLDAGSWFSPQYADEEVPTLTEALLATQGNGRLYLDIKVGGMGPAIANSLAQANYDAADLVMWPAGGGDLQYASQLHQAVPGAEIWVASAPNWQNDPGVFDDLALIGVTGFDVPYSQLTDSFIAAAQNEGFVVSTFTLNDPDQLAEAIARGIDCIETDFPHSLAQMLEVTVIEAPVETIEIQQGLAAGGTVADLGQSDNVDFRVQRNPLQVAARIDIELEGTSHTALPTLFQITVEDSVFARANIIQTIELFNFDTGQFDQVHSSPVSRIGDDVITATANGDLSAYVEPGSLAVRARLLFETAVQRAAFTANIDEVFWTISN